MIRSNDAEAKSEPPEEDPTRRRFPVDSKDLLDEELPDVPVEGFGAAILVGYGWSEGKGIGLSSKEHAKVFEDKWCVGTEGLGYMQQVAFNSNSLSVKRSQEEIASGFTLVNVKGADNVLRVEHKAESRDNGSGWNERRSKDIRKEESVREVKCSRDEHTKSVEDTNGRRIDYAEKSHVRWLISHIRVRVISKMFRGWNLYLRKRQVVDVVGSTTCDIMMDGSNELVQGVDQDILETTLPKHRVMYLLYMVRTRIFLKVW